MSRPLISLDAAGTLIQVKEPVGRTYAAFAQRHGVAVEEAALKAAFRTVWGQLDTPLWPEGSCAPDDERGWWHELVRRVFAHALGEPLPGVILDPLFQELYAYFARPEAWMVFDDVRPALTDLARDHRLCVLSNFDGRLRGILRGHDLERYFEQVIVSSEVGAAKPHARMFETALRVMGAAAETSWHVGDDERCDLQGAQSCGWQAYLVVRPGSDLLGLCEKVRFRGNSSLHTSRSMVGNSPHPRG